jgi:predicted alpha-1,2-mannosidase
MKKLYLILFTLLLSGCGQLFENDPLRFVNPFIGTDGHGHTYPGAAIPFGMVQLSPDTRKDDWDGCSGYHYSDSSILGFSHTHLSGTGVGDYGDIRFMPMAGALKIRPGQAGDTGSGYRSRFSHEREKASPGFYQVFLEDCQVTVSLTVTPRCGLHEYAFQSGEEAIILIDLTESIVTEKNSKLHLEIVNDREVRGYRHSTAWAKDQRLYFHAEFSVPFASAGIAVDGKPNDQLLEAGGKDIQGYFRFGSRKDERILVKVGISAVSEDGAFQNLKAELPGWDFDAVRRQAEKTWRDELGKIEVQGGTDADKTKFYTALYHAFLAPNLFSDIDGRYRGHDGNIHQAQGFEMYTVFSLWDTYRALHPLLTILQPERSIDFIRSMMEIYEKGGLLPVWELAGNETFCMIGYHAVPVIADAYFKGIRGFDIEKAYEASVHSAMREHFGLAEYKTYGYIPAEKEGEAISKTLEYAYDDWCIAMMAKDLGKEEDYRYFMERAQSYKNLFDPQTGFIRGKRNGMFVSPFDPAEVNFMLTEANTWQYTFYVPQDISGLMTYMGGRDGFETMLDRMFTAADTLSGRRQADITGLIGQYAHGNEPSHHMAYLYNYAGKPHKTQKLVRKIMQDLYGDGPDGLCGNEDCGQMSAWFVMSALGFYPVTPASGIYAIGSPLFEQAIINLPGNQKFYLSAQGNNDDNIYIQSARLDGDSFDRSYLSHPEIMNGGEITFRMGSRPSSFWATSEENCPVSEIKDHLITPVPYFQASSSSFQDTLMIRLKHIDPEASISYNQENGQASGIEFYGLPFIISDSRTYNAVAVSDITGNSKAARAVFHRIGHGWTVTLKNLYSPQYTAGGEIALIDGQRGGMNFRTGSWQGYHGVDFEAVVDLGSDRPVSKVMVSFLQDQNSWIFMPEEVTIMVSRKPFDYRTIAILKNDVPDQTEEPVIKEFTREGLRETCRYVKVNARNRGVCPDWHIGAGQKAWIFIDEIGIE